MTTKTLREAAQRLTTRLQEDAEYHRRIANDCDCRPEDTANWQHATNAEDAAHFIDAIISGVHRSDCAIHNAPAEPTGPCNCGATLADEGEAQPVTNNDEAAAYMDARLWEFIDMAAAFPSARVDERTWPHVLVYAPQPAEREQDAQQQDHSEDALDMVAAQQPGQPQGEQCGCPKEGYCGYGARCTDAAQPHGEHPPLPEPDTHCFDDDTGKDVWSFSADLMHAYLEADRAQRRAVEPSKPNRITIDFKRATELLEMFGGEPSEITLINGSGHSGPGLYAYYEQIPEDGAMCLGQVDDEAAPEQRRAVELTVERIAEIAHRRASVYLHADDPAQRMYTFKPHTLEDLVRDVERYHGIK